MKNFVKCCLASVALVLGGAAESAWIWFPCILGGSLILGVIAFKADNYDTRSTP